MYDLDIKEALARLPREIVDARNQRLKRAMDLSMKHQYLPEDLQVFFFFFFSLIWNLLFFLYVCQHPRYILIASDIRHMNTRERSDIVCL